MAGNTGETETRLALGGGGYGSHSTLARRTQNVILMGGASGNAGSPGTSRLGHLSQQGIWGQKPAGHSQWSLPQEAHVPDGLILQLWPK